MDFLWHKISEQDKKEIKREAKKIIDNFANSLKNLKKIESSGVKRDNQLRTETKVDCDPKFRDAFFDNAPKTSGDWIKAEKGKWK